MVLITRFDFDPAMIRFHTDNGGDKLPYGAKVLGSYLGSEESIANRLEKKLAELKKEADAYTWFEYTSLINTTTYTHHNTVSFKIAYTSIKLPIR